MKKALITGITGHEGSNLTEFLSEKIYEVHGVKRRTSNFKIDLADICIYLMNIPDCDFRSKLDKHYSHVNVGYGADLTNSGLAELIREVGGFEGCSDCDWSKPNGTSQKMLNSQLINGLGWVPITKLTTGLALVLEEFIEQGWTKK